MGTKGVYSRRKYEKMPEPEAHRCCECKHFKWSLRTPTRDEDGHCVRLKPELRYHGQEACSRFERQEGEQ